jgi:hypothetical protein
MLRGVRPSTGRVKETETQVAALALQRAGCLHREIACLLVAGGLKGPGEGNEDRIKSLLHRAKRNANAQAAAEGVTTAVGVNERRMTNTSARPLGREVAPMDDKGSAKCIACDNIFLKAELEDGRCKQCVKDDRKPKPKGGSGGGAYIVNKRRR